MNEKEYFQYKLSEIRLRYTGKDPFGPWTNLKDLHLECVNNSVLQNEFNSFIHEYSNDPFWHDFIEFYLSDI